MRIVVATTVHHPLDARIFHRQIRALTGAGHRVTYVAPWRATGTVVPDAVVGVDVPRSVGWRRLASLRAARRVLHQLVPSADLLLLHDPELLLVAAGLRRRLPVVWDVHEDTAGALGDRGWIPSPLRGGLARGVRMLERIAEGRVRLLLAEAGYRDRFRDPHPVIPNEPWVPPAVAAPGRDRVVHLGRLSPGRGLETLLTLPDHLPEGVHLELVGPADADVASTVAAAADAGRLVWTGFVPNDAALDRVEGSLAGLCLVRDSPNTRVSRLTKVVEYMARGVPVIATPLPEVARLVEAHHCGATVPFDDPAAVGAIVRHWRDDDEDRVARGRRGHEAARAAYDWHRSGPRFVQTLEAWASGPPRSTRRSDPSGDDDPDGPEQDLEVEDR